MTPGTVVTAVRNTRGNVKAFRPNINTVCTEIEIKGKQFETALPNLDNKEY